MITPPPLIDPPARAAVRVAFASIIDELEHRIDIHRRLFRLVWNCPDYTPQEFFNECGAQGAKFLEIAGANLNHIAALALLDGKTLNDMLDPSEYTPPAPYTVHHDGTITLNS